MRWNRARHLGPLLLAFAALGAGCSNESEPAGPSRPDSGPGPTIDPDAPTYHGEIADIVERRCSSCHEEGGIGPVRLDTYEDLKEHAGLAKIRIMSGEMPPWMPDPECRRYLDERLMPDAEKDIFARWVEAQMPEGDPADRPADGSDPLRGEEQPAIRPGVFTATDRVEMPEEYTPNQERPDDHRCFILDSEFPEDTYLIGSDINPGTDSIVHHVIVYALDGSVEDTLREADAAEPGPGYECYGGPMPGGSRLSSQGVPTMLAGWAPGNPPLRSRDGTALRIRKGSVVVMQVHYNTLTERGVSDRTEFLMELTDQPPERLVESRPAVITNLDIPAGEEHVRLSRDFVNYTDRDQVIGFVAGHMHKLGVRITTELVRGDAHECLLDIPEWDFNWQQAYTFRPGEEEIIHPGDAVRITCDYDNSPEHQPVVNGERLTPRDVSFGEGTLDEMCLAFLGIVSPFREAVAPPTVACGNVNRCMNGGSPLGDVLGCEDPGLGCLQCMVPGILDCATACVPKLIVMRDCFEHCANGAFFYNGAVGPCLEAECGPQYQELKDCLDPLVDDEACRAATTECGLELPTH